MARRYSKKDCLLMYDDESCSSNEDNSLLVSYVSFVDGMLKSEGLITHHQSRDSTPGQSIISELGREVESSQVVLLIVDKGFLKDSWKSFCKDVTIKKLIDESPRSPGSTRLIPILIDLEKNDIPMELRALKCIHIMNESDINDKEKWLALKRGLSYHIEEKSQPPASTEHNHQRTLEYPNTSADPSESRVNPEIDTILPIPNNVNTTSNSFSTGGNESRQSHESEPKTCMHGSSSSNTATPFREVLTSLRTLSLQSTDLEVDDTPSLHMQSPFLDTGRDSSHLFPIMDVSSSLNRNNALVNSSIQQNFSDGDVNQNLETPIEASGRDLLQGESLDTLTEPSIEPTTPSASGNSLGRPTVAVQPFTSNNTNDDNDQRRSVDTLNSSNTLPDDIDSLL